MEGGTDADRDRAIRAARLDALGISGNRKPDRPVAPMTFEQQADLLEYLHGRATLKNGKTYDIAIFAEDQSFMDDLWVTMQRLRRMAPHEDAIRELVQRGAQ